MANTFDIYQNCQNELSLVFPLEMIGDNTLRVLFYTFHVALINLAFADMTSFESSNRTDQTHITQIFSGALS